MDNMNAADPQKRLSNETGDEWNTRPDHDRQNNSHATMILLAVALLIGLGDGIYSYRLDQQAAEIQSNLRDTISSQGETIQKLHQQMAESGERFSSLATDVYATRDHLGSTQSELKKTRHMADTLAKQEKESSEQLSGQLGQLQQEQSTTQGTVGNLSSDVSGVKEDVNSTKEQLASTRNDLQRAIGDMGVQSDLIAHNKQELAELRLLGERDYQEFDIRKSNQPQRVGNIAITLKKTDAKRQKFTFNLVVDDRTIEKKDKTVNEPVQFYQDGYRQPTEIVANQIDKDRIVGYVSYPKKKEARITASTAKPAGAGF